MGASNSETPKRTLDQVLESLQRFAKHPEGYVHPVSIRTVEIYLAGFVKGCVACDVLCNWPQWLDGIIHADEVRGWEPNSISTVPQMRAKGMDDGAIIQELIAIHAEAFRLAAILPPDPPGTAGL